MPITARNTNIEYVKVISIPAGGGAGTSYTNFHGFKFPADSEVTRVDHVPQAAWTAAAAANDGAVTLKRNNTGTAVAASGTIATALARGSLNNIATLDGTTKFFAAGDNLTIDLTANGTAVAPVTNVVIRFRAKQAQ